MTDYATGIQYRVWGAPKAAAYSSGFNASAKYTARMQVAEFDIPAVLGGTYSYNDDGQLGGFIATTPQYSQYDRRMDRAFSYEEFGRMNSSVANVSGFTANYSPQQDEFGNVKNAAYHYWQNGPNSTSFSATYQNNRIVPGTVTDNGVAQTWNYDAMGNRTSIVKTVGGTTLESVQVDAVGRGVGGGLDGEGRAVVIGGGENFLCAINGIRRRSHNDFEFARSQNSQACAGRREFDRGTDRFLCPLDASRPIESGCARNGTRTGQTASPCHYSERRAN